MMRLRGLIPVIVAAIAFYAAQPLLWHEARYTAAYADETNQSVPAMTANFDGTPAANNLETADQNGTKIQCSTLTEAKGGVFLGRIIPCLIYTIERSTESFSEKMINLFKPMFYSFLVLVITFFGVKVLQGEREIGPQAFMLLFKIALVIGLMESIPHYFVPKTYGIMSDGVSIVTDALGPNSSQISCDVNQYGDANTPLIWKQMDCVMGKLYGFATGTGNTGPNGAKPVNMLLASSAFGLLTGFFFGGTLGVAVFFAMVGVLWSVAMLVLRTTLAFMNGYLIVCIMLIMTPLFLPLVLLKVTGDYFERWWKAILGGLLLPVVVVTYSMFALLMYDKVLFKPDSLVHQIFNDQTIKDALQQSEKLCDVHITNDPHAKGNNGQATESELDDIIKNNPFMKTLGQPLLAGGTDACAMFQKPKLDVKKINWSASSFADPNARNDADSIMRRMFMDCIKLLITTMLIAAGVRTLEGTVASLTGSSSTRTALTAKSEVETRIETAMHQAKDRVGEAFTRRDGGGGVTNQKGGDFLRSLPQATQSGIQSFMDKLSEHKRK